MINEIRKRLGRSEKVELECVDKDGFLYYEAGHNLEEKKKVLESSLVIDPEKSKWGNYFFIEGSDSFVAGAEIKYFRIKELNTKQQYDFKDLVHFSEKAVKDGVLKEMELEHGVLTVIAHKCGYLYSVSDHATSDFIDSCMDSLKQEYKKQGVEFGDLKVKINGVALADLGKPDFNDLIDVAVQAYKDGVLPDMELDESGLSSSKVMCCISAYEDNIKKAINDIQALYTETFTVESEDDIEKIANGESHVKLSNGNNVPYSELMNLLPSMLFLVLKGATITQKRGK